MGLRRAFCLALVCLLLVLGSGSVLPGPAPAVLAEGVADALKPEAAGRRVPEAPPPEERPENAVPSPEPVPEIPLLVSPDCPLPADYVPEGMVPLSPGSDLLLLPEAAGAYARLRAAAAEAGIGPLYAVSAYRSFAVQDGLHRAKTERLRAVYGEAAGDEAARIVARPGASEHQAGLAVDVSATGALLPSFGATAEGVWLAENAWRYGFIIRYPADKTEVTGVVYEPWHLRYLGRAGAAAVYASGDCLEEYVETLRNGAPARASRLRTGRTGDGAA